MPIRAPVSLEYCGTLSCALLAWRTQAGEPSSDTGGGTYPHIHALETILLGSEKADSESEEIPVINLKLGGSGEECYMQPILTS